MNSEHLDLFSKKEWLDDLLERLSLFTSRLIRANYWRGEYGGHIPGGLEPVDVAMEAIQDVLSGKRAWDSDKYPNVFTHLCWVVRSKLSAWNISPHNRLETRFESELHDDAPDSEPNSVDISDDLDFLIGFIEYIEAEDGKELSEVVSLMEAGYTREEMARKLGVSVEEITNRRKKLGRRLDSYCLEKYGRKPVRLSREQLKARRK